MPDKRATRRIDLVPDWIRVTADENAVTGVNQSETLSYSDGNINKTLRAVLRTGNDYSSVSLHFLEIEGNDALIYEKKHDLPQEAESDFKKLSERLTAIKRGALVEGLEGATAEQIDSLIEEYRKRSDQLPDTNPADTGSRTQTSLAPGWNIIDIEGRLLVAFSHDFLKKSLDKFKKALSGPIQPPETIYNTSSRPHCGLDDFVVSRWRKVKTADGNIVRNMVQIDRIGSSVPIIIEKVSNEIYNRICSNLTPDAAEYGIAYDSVTGKWFKVAKVVMRTLWFDSVAEVKEYQEGEVGKSPEGEKLEGKPPPETKPFEELMEEMPEGSAEESLPKEPGVISPEDFPLGAPKQSQLKKKGE